MVALLNAYKAKRDLTQALESVVTWDQLAESVNKAEELLGPDDSGQMRSMYPQYRQYSPTLLKAFDFKGAPNSQPLLKAIDLLGTLDESGKRKVPRECTSRLRWSEVAAACFPSRRRH